ncbi:hypothetical protein BaRGS_00000911, partial [Batillaria attramentaria]
HRCDSYDSFDGKDRGGQSGERFADSSRASLMYYPATALFLYSPLNRPQYSTAQL